MSARRLTIEGAEEDGRIATTNARPDSLRRHPLGRCPPAPFAQIVGIGRQKCGQGSGAFFPPPKGGQPTLVLLQSVLNDCSRSRMPGGIETALFLSARQVVDLPAGDRPREAEVLGLRP